MRRILSIIKKELLFLFSSTGIISKKYVVNTQVLPTYSIKSEDLDFNYKNTNKIIKVNIANRTYYFREFLNHTNWEQYISTVLDRFSDFFGDLNNIDEIDIIRQSYQRKHNRIRLRFLGTRNDKYSLYNVSLLKNDPKIIGIDSNTYTDCLKKFSRYIWGEVYQYRLNWRRNNYQVYCYLRAQAQEKLYELLLSDQSFLCSSHIAKLLVDGDVKIGSLQEKAEGINIDLLSNAVIRGTISPKLQRLLGILNCMDYICWERDHRPSNFNVQLDNSGTCTGISVFDNDSPESFFPVFSRFFSSYMGSSSLINTCGEINRPYLDKNFCNKILTINDDSIVEVITPFLNFIQIRGALYRLHILQRAIAKTIKNNKGFQISEDDFCDKTIAKELSGKYGKTYLSIYFNFNLNYQL